MVYLVTIFLLILSGLFSGLTLGLLSLDVSELKRKTTLRTPEAKLAKKVYPVRKKGNLLLSTLLLGNVAVNAALAIFLGSVATGVVAGVVATGLIVVFGEIIPQASISRYALKVGAKTAWLVRIFIVILLPVAYPIAWALDKALGEEMPTIYSKHELMKIVEEHEKDHGSEVDADEHRIIKGALSFSDKTAKDAMTPRTVVFSLSASEVVGPKLIEKIKKNGFNRIPVYEKKIDNVVGLLYVTDLVGARSGTKVGKICERKRILKVLETDKLDDLLDLFLKARIHLAFVTDEYGGLEGVLSLEDIVEEVVGVEIVDESDRYVDMQEKAKILRKDKDDPPTARQ